MNIFFGTFAVMFIMSNLNIWESCIAGVSHQSTTSETSCDYANPPDDTTSRSDSDTSEPEQKLLKYTEGTSKQVRKNPKN